MELFFTVCRHQPGPGDALVLLAVALRRGVMGRRVRAVAGDATLARVVGLLGGAGWVRGALLGGLALGTTESFVSGYLSTRFSEVVTFGLLIAALLLLPEGVLARSRLRHV